MERAEALDTLRSAYDNGRVADKDKGFVGSLIEQAGKRGLSDKQWYWVVKLATAIMAPPPAAVQVGSFERVYAMFMHAKQHLQRPKIRLTFDEREVSIYLASARSRMPDVVNVVFGDVWAGRVMPTGEFAESGRLDSETAGTLRAFLQTFADSPEQIAAEYGKLTGNCCFCARPLTDERSTDVGYGPICAKRYQLSWGGKKK